ncbi:MAG: molecular chaperone DnaJ [Cyanobacteriota bacterium]|nr:molecular chaperone DnaJ [Cyanobium sp. 49614_E6]MCE2837367.1 molecular chaperone DnaJ [Cyanobium sp. 49614_E6]
MSMPLVVTGSAPGQQQAHTEPESKGFGGGGSAKAKAKETGNKGGAGRKRRGSGLSAADRSPLGRSPDLEAMQARHRLGLALAGRLREGDVTRAWKLAAAEHHPDRGGAHDTMQAINAARVLLLGLDSD